jgi:hypothetical protein
MGHHRDHSTNQEQACDFSKVCTMFKSGLHLREGDMTVYDCSGDIRGCLTSAHCVCCHWKELMTFLKPERRPKPHLELLALSLFCKWASIWKLMDVWVVLTFWVVSNAAQIDLYESFCVDICLHLSGMYS